MCRCGFLGNRCLLGGYRFFWLLLPPSSLTMLCPGLGHSPGYSMFCLLAYLLNGGFCAVFHLLYCLNRAVSGTIPAARCTTGSSAAPPLLGQFLQLGRHDTVGPRPLLGRLAAFATVFDFIVLVTFPYSGHGIASIFELFSWMLQQCNIDPSTFFPFPCIFH